MSRSKKLLTKSRFLKGLQCERFLWLCTYEPDAEELRPGPSTTHRFRVGDRIGEVARTYVPGGVLINRAQDFLAPINATQEALKRGASVLYEATFLVEDIYSSIDILTKDPDGWILIEVKSSTKVKEEHLPDIAIQVHLARKAGLTIKRAEVMVLNRGCRYPDLSNLFTRIDVTDEIQTHLAAAEKNIDRFLKTIQAKAAPNVAPGPHCSKPRECPFVVRCCGEKPAHHVGTLYKVDPSTATKLEASGYATILYLDSDAELDFSAIQTRQIQAVKSGALIVEQGLAKALVGLKGPLGFLDFETVMPAIPLWDGCRPYDQVPAQFSFHLEKGDGYEHHEWVPSGPGDPRPALADALIQACQGAETILAYNAQFERSCIDHLQERLPELSEDLEAISGRIVDLLPIVRNHVYHPAFFGSFSIKAVLPALCPDLSYEDLEIQEGGTASQILELILTGEGAFSPEERARHVQNLRKYCELDTWAMVRLLNVLRSYSNSPKA